MDTARIAEWIANHNGWLSPPGCEYDYVSLPTRNDRCCTVGIVHEHRFAFYFWAKYAIDKKELPHAALVSLDYHDDVGVPSEVIPNDLDNLNLHSDIELGLFSWLCLRSLNDGHIRPALYLNFFSDAYILISKEMDAVGFNITHSDEVQEDRYQNPHNINFYQDAAQMLNDIPPSCPIFLDIDLDYFSIENPKAKSVNGSELLRSDEEISSFLSVNGTFIRPLLDRLVGISIALEPECCGGLVNSLHVLDILNQELFNGTLCTNSCKWREITNQ